MIDHKQDDPDGPAAAQRPRLVFMLFEVPTIDIGRDRRLFGGSRPACKRATPPLGFQRPRQSKTSHDMTGADGDRRVGAKNSQPQGAASSDDAAYRDICRQRALSAAISGCFAKRRITSS